MKNFQNAVMQSKGSAVVQYAKLDLFKLNTGVVHMDSSQQYKINTKIYKYTFHKSTMNNGKLYSAFCVRYFVDALFKLFVIGF